jgi:RNA polymerase-binding transcription factor DksA
LKITRPHREETGTGDAIIIMKTRNPTSAALHVPSKWRWHYEKLQAMRESLLADHATLAAESSEPMEPPGIDNADGATDEFDHNLALGILAHEEDALFEVDAAIQRILDGSYGICEITGKPIPDVRLRVVPWTRYTKEALERLERLRLVERPHLSSVASLQGAAPGGLAEAPEPEADEPISREAARHRRADGIRDLAGDAGLTITSDLTPES